MKTTLIFSTLIFLTALMGCSDNMNVTDPLNQQNYPGGKLSQQTVPDNHNGDAELLWKLDELSVSATDEYMVENKAVYTNQHITYIANYLITFDVYTDADKFTNGYRPLVQVFRDEETVFESTAFPEEDGEVISHKEVRLDNVRFTNLTLRIALFQGDGPPVIENGDITTLKLSNIKVFMFD